MLDKTTPPPLPNTTVANNHTVEANYSFIDWFKEGLRNYVNFSGRARRKEYWYFILVQICLVIIAMILDTVVFGSESESFNVGVAFGMLVPSITVCVRRLHDTDCSGWWFLISLVPLLGILLIVFLASDTKPETNQWGSPAK